MPMVDLAIRLQSTGLLWPALLVLVKATLILVIARLLLAALPNVSAATKHLGLSIALCSVIALPLLEVAIPAWRVVVFHTHPGSAAQPKAAIGATGDEDDAPPSAVAAAVTVAKAAGVVPEAKLDALSRGIGIAKQSWQGFVLIALFAVSIAFLLRMVAGVIGVGAVARRSEAIAEPEALGELARACEHLGLIRPVHLLRSQQISVPVVWGLFKPILLLPAASSDWPAERLRVVLLHELAHVKRGDGITLLVTRAAVALFWFHPLMWSLERAARAECERACDDLVLDSGTKPSDYADHLLSIAKALPQVDPFRSVTLAMTRRSQLEGRLLSILQPHVRRAHFSATAVSVVGAIALLLLVPFAAVRLVAAPQASSTTIDVVADREPKEHTFDLQKIIDTTEVLVARYERLTSRKAPESGRDWYQQGMKLHNNREFEAAIASFKQSAAHGYRVEDAMYNISCAYAQMHDAANASKWLRDAIAAGYDDYDHIASDDDFDPVRNDREFATVVAEAPQHRHGDRDTAAIQRYATLSRLADADGEAWFSVGYDLLPVRRYDESIDAFQHAREKGYKPATSLYNIACGYSRKGDTTHALAYLEKALNEGFDSPDKLEDDRDLDNLRRDPRFAEFKKMANDLRLQGVNIVTMIVNGNNWSDSLPHFREMARRYPNTGRSWFNLGYAALQAGNNGESIQAFRRALDMHYRVPATTYDIACAYARSNQNDAALEWLEKARDSGFELCNYIDKDSDLAGLRSDERFRELRKEVLTEK